MPHTRSESRAPTALPPPSAHAQHWALDPAVVYLNHGSFGACPRVVLDEQTAIRDEMEREAVRFFTATRFERAMDRTRESLAAFLACRPQDLAPVPNATTGVATVLANQGWSPGDEVLLTDHEYPACRHNLLRVAERARATVVQATIPWPLRSEDDAARAILDRVTPRTRFALISHVTSPSGLVLPIERLTRELEGRGVRVLIDGAHAPGFVKGLALDAIGASYYTANCHKWLCAPKGSALLHVRADRQEGFRPLVLSNNAQAGRPGRSTFLVDFDYVGTRDYTAWLAIPAAIELMATLDPGGWPGVMDANRALLLRARAMLCRSLGTEPPAPESMLGSLAAIFLPPHEPARAARLAQRPTRFHDALWDALVDRHGIQVPIWGVAGTPHRVLRISAQRYNSMEQYEYLARALAEELEAERSL